MKYPSLIIDNFFDNPDEIRDYANDCEWYRVDRIIGYRTEDLTGSDKHREFFHFIAHKLLLLIDPHNTRDIRYRANLFFQKQIPGKSHLDGWVHKDGAELSAIMYLNKNDTFGTNLYKRKHQWSEGVITHEGGQGENVKHRGFINCEKPDFDEEEFLKDRSKNNDNFEMTAEIKGLYNRLFMFDSASYHAMVTPPPAGDKDERLILMIMFHDIYKHNFKNGLIESKRFTI